MMKHLKLALKNREKAPTSWEALKANEIIKKVRNFFPSESHEIAILRKEIAALREALSAFTGEPCGTDEFAQYNSTVEAEKNAVKMDMGEII